MESEIELDKMRTDGAGVAKKEEQLAEMQKQSMALTAEIGEQIVDLTEEIHKNNEPVEKVEDDEMEENDIIAKEGEESVQKTLDVMQTRIEQYKHMQQMSEAPETTVSLVDASA